MICEICSHHCNIKENETGFCQARANVGGKITCINYGRLTALALDPIEKKPLKRFYPGSKILSIGSFGCNLRCGFCQNHNISMVGNKTKTAFMSPEELVIKASQLTKQGNIGLAYTYNEPLIGYEFVRDCAAIAQESGLKNVLVTNGLICAEPLMKLLPNIDAMNIDLKGFSEDFYQSICGNFETVKATITASANACHVEVATLIIPGINDSADEMDLESKWLASISPEIPLHINRFFPSYKMLDKESTPFETIHALCKIASRHLKYVYAGNC